jgi:type II secretory pathway pseudopilin PulG
MTLLELIAAMVVISLVLGALVGVCNALANDSAQQQTLETLRTLNKALGAYVIAHGAYPDAEAPRHIDTPMARCIAALRSSASTEHMVADLSGLTATADHWFTVYDGFGQPMRYIHPGDDSPQMTARVKAFPRSPKGHPFVVSAGPDGQFGDVSSDDPQQRIFAADNLSSLDLETEK